MILFSLFLIKCGKIRVGTLPHAWAKTKKGVGEVMGKLSFGLTRRVLTGKSCVYVQ